MREGTRHFQRMTRRLIRSAKNQRYKMKPHWEEVGELHPRDLLEFGFHTLRKECMVLVGSRYMVSFK